MPAHSLCCYYHDSCAKVQNQILLYFPRNLPVVTMKSGCSFHKSCTNEVYVKAFPEEMSSSTRLRNGTLKYSEDKIGTHFHLSIGSSRDPLGTMVCWLKLISVTRSLPWMLLLLS
jgi:hypothetical protein